LELQDDVPNVKFVAAQILQNAIPLYDRSRVTADIKPQLAALVNDPDKDVQYFATVALEHC
jgi:hypothetical protein